MRSALITIVVLSLLALLVAPGNLQAASPAGKWRGSWSSQTTGHRGPLRARIRRIDSDTYRAIFMGRFAGVIPFIYPARLQRVPGTCNQYTSRQRLLISGEYQMTATVSANRFRANFRARKDRGSFDMSR